MERHICTWKENTDEKEHVGELIIDGNFLEFYLRDSADPFPHAYIGDNGEHLYKVFVRGLCDPGKHRTLNNTTSFRPYLVLVQNNPFDEGLVVDGISSFSFIIPELIDWLDMTTIKLFPTEELALGVKAKKISPIVLKKSNPHIEIVFWLQSWSKHTDVDTRTTFVVEKQPRLVVSYDSPVKVQRVQIDIDILMQFFGLMIGHVSNAEDIQIHFQEKDSDSFLFVNRDYSYNIRFIDSWDKPRTKLSIVGDFISDYFTKWYDFYMDEHYSLVRRIYFDNNKRKEIFAEDILVLYVRILEGYHLRLTGDEEQADKIERAFKNIEKSIKKLIFTDEGKPLFEAALEASIPDWKYNSKHASSISQWIARGFLSRTGLAERLKALDEQHFNIISNNAIETLYPGKNDELSEKKEEIADQFFNSIVATRNYYSHFKSDKTNVLPFSAMNDTINTLKALIIMIMYTNMGMEKELIRRIMVNDSELHWQTMFIRGTNTETATAD